MNKTLALVLVVAVILGGVLMLFLTGGQEGRGGGGSSPGASTERSGALTPAELARPDELAEAGSGAAARTEAAVEARRARATDAPHAVGNSENFATDDARWVEVTVVLPAGVPADDVPALISFSPDDGEELDQWDRRNLSQDVGLAGDFVEEIDGDLVWARRELSGTNTVRMPFHPTAREGVLMLQSRYVFADVESVTLGLSDESVAPVTIEGELGAYVTGVCLIPAGAEDRDIEADDIDLELDGRPRDGGMVFAMNDSREPRIRDDFTFELRALSANKKYAVQAQAEKLVDYFDISFMVEAGQHTVLEIPFELGGEIRGRVVGEDGQPIADADVQVETQGMVFGDNEEETETAADGTFVVSGLSAGKVEVRVEAKGWREKVIEDLELSEGQRLSNYEIVLERGNTIAGTVRWADGSPAEDASVLAIVVQEQGWRASRGRTRTDADGRFTITGLGEGPYQLRAEGNPDRTKQVLSARIEGFPDEVFAEELGYIEHSTGSGTKVADEIGGDSDWVAVLDGVAANTLGVELVLREPLVLSGFVKDDTGVPVTTEFRVEARPAGASPWGSSVEVDDEFETADGSFHLQGFFPGEWMVSVDADGYTAPEEELRVTIPATTPIELVLLRGAAVSGVVLDPFGKPAAKASVVAQQGAQGNPFNFGAGDDTETDAEGRFSFDAASPTGMSLVASHPDWAASEPLSVEAVAGGSVDDVMLHLRMGAVITGEVFDENGEPDAGQNVTAGSQGFGGFGGGNGQVTDSAGRFRFEHVTPGQVIVTAMPREEDIIAALEEAGGEETAMMNFMGQMRMQRVEVEDGEEVHVVLGAKPKDPVKITGRVTEAGSPLTETQIVVIEEGGSIMEGLKATRTDANGRYEVTVDRPGDFVFNVDMGDGGGTGIPFFVDVPERPEFEHDLVLPLGRISGRVFGPDGEPASAVSVRVSQMGGVFGLEDFNVMTNQTTAADGSYEFEHLTAGKYSLQVGGTGTFFSGDAERFGAVVLDGIEVKENGNVEGIDVRLSSPGKLAGSVRDSAGKPVAGAAIFVRDSKGRAIGSISTTMTDGSGRFTYGGLAPGAITVCARTSKDASEDVGPIDIVAGETSEVELEVNAGTYVVVTLLDGEELVRARVQVTDENGRQVNGLISAEQIQQFLVDGFSSKERRIGPVPPGKYTLVATTAEGLEAKKTVSIKAGQAERKVKLRLR